MLCLFRPVVAQIRALSRWLLRLPPEVGASITGVAVVALVGSPAVIRLPGPAGIFDLMLPEQSISARADPFDPDAQEIASVVAAAADSEADRADLIVSIVQAKIRYATDEHVWGAADQGRVPSLAEMRLRAKEQGWSDLRGDCRHAAVLTLSVSRALGMHARVSVWRGLRTGHAWIDVRTSGGEWLSLDADGHGAGIPISGRPFSAEEIRKVGAALEKMQVASAAGRLRFAAPLLERNWSVRFEQMRGLLPVGVLILLASSDVRLLLRRAWGWRKPQSSPTVPHTWGA